MSIIMNIIGILYAGALTYWDWYKGWIDVHIGLPAYDVHIGLPTYGVSL